MHWSFDNDDPAKRGQPILTLGQPTPRRAKDAPNCRRCPARFRWTPEQRRTWRRYAAARVFGAHPRDADEAWDWSILYEIERRTEAEMKGPQPWQ